MRNTPPGPHRVRSAHESRSATVRAAAAAPSRRQRSRWQREQHQQRTLYIAIGALGVVVAAIFIGGLIWDNVVRANQSVAQVGSETITATQLADDVRTQARPLDAQAKQLGSAANIANYVNQQKRSLPDQVLNTLIDERIIAQEAARRGISVSPPELDDKERQSVADFQAANNPTPTPEATATAEAAAAPEAGSPALTSSTPALAAATVVTPTTPTAVPTLEEAAYGGALRQLLDKSSLTEAELRRQLERSLLRERLLTAIGQEQVLDTREEVHARQIVVAAQDQAVDLVAQLQGGADFAQLAAQYSTEAASKDKGGDMGWFARGVQSKAVEDAAFGLQPGQLSDVVQDAGGLFHILNSVEREAARAVPPAQLSGLRQKAFSEWLSTQRSSADVKLSLDQGTKEWVLSRVGVRP